MIINIICRSRKLHGGVFILPGCYVWHRHGTGNNTSGWILLSRGLDSYLLFFYKWAAESHVVSTIVKAHVIRVISFHSNFIILITSLEMLDKSDPPVIPEGYCMSVAYACLLDIVRSISLVVDSVEAQSCGSESLTSTATNANEKGTSSEENAFSIQLVNSSWCGLLAALTLLLEAR